MRSPLRQLRAKHHVVNVCRSRNNLSISLCSPSRRAVHSSPALGTTHEQQELAESVGYCVRQVFPSAGVRATQRHTSTQRNAGPSIITSSTSTRVPMIKGPVVMRSKARLEGIGQVASLGTWVSYYKQECCFLADLFTSQSASGVRFKLLCWPSRQLAFWSS